MLKFVSSPCLSYETSLPTNNKPKRKIQWTNDTSHQYPFFIEEAKHLIDLRNKKNTHFHHLQNKVKNYYRIRQEYLKQDVKEMIETFQLEYSSCNLLPYRKPKQYKLPKNVVDFINQHLNNPLDS